MLPAIACAWILTATASSSTEPETRKDLIVEEAQSGLVADRAGVKPGDVLLRWRRAASPPANPEPAAGEFDGPFDVLFVEQEELPRGEFRVTLRRGVEQLELVLPQGMWRLKVKPPLPAAEDQVYEAARAQVAGAEPAQGLARWRDLARAWRAAGQHEKSSWLLYTLARAAVEKRLWPTADAAFTEALEVAREGGLRIAAGFILTFHGRSLETRGQLDAAHGRHQEALEEYRTARPASLLEAWGKAQVVRVLYDRGDLDGAEALNRENLALRERLAPESSEVAGSLMELAMAAELRGDLAAAAAYDERALRLLEQGNPTNPDLPGVLGNLAGIVHARGDLAAAERHLLRAAAMAESLAPGSAKLAWVLSNLGVVAADRGDLEAAEHYHQRALAIQEQRTPGGRQVAITLTGLGAVALKRGDLAAADKHYLRALEIHERLAPEAFTIVQVLLSLAEVAEQRADLDGAEAHLHRAQKLIEKLGLSGLELSACWHALGRVARRRGQPAAAEALFERALSIRRELTPGSAAEAETYHELALIAAEGGRVREALDLHRHALEALEAQRSRLGGSDEAKSRFGAQYAGYYHSAIDLLVSTGRAEEAFGVLERFRARGFLALLAEKELVFSRDVPAELDRERRVANVDHDRTLAELSAGRGAEVAKHRQALAEIRRRQSEIQTRIRAASPRLATLQYPQPLDLPAARQALDPGTLLLSYVIGDDKGYVFAVGPSPQEFQALALDTDRKRLREAVVSFRRLLQQQSGLRRASLESAARALTRLLLAPVAERLRRAERVIVVPDGPLQLVPFGALADPLSAGGRLRYLIEAKPLHVAASATVFAELKKGRRERAAVRLVAFGDPDYSAARAPRAAQRLVPESAIERRLQLVTLPAARHEVRNLQLLFPEGQIYLGAAATEEQAKAVDRHASLIHFACHGLSDEDSPLDSALALSLPATVGSGRENGLLQTWEIFEQVRIEADLVTLSACGTALGKELSGEGILGLTRAFQYAGARSVLASLWTVNDASTAELMKRFYSHLKQGQTKDWALRAAQIELLRRPVSSHPSRWAAFQLVGDWR